MKLITAFLRLVRWPNLVFIFLTQFLYYYCILEFVQGRSREAFVLLSLTNFYLLVIASLLIAAAGYIINDYFDLNIDLVNKPSRIVIDRFIKRRFAILLHVAFSFAGFLLSAYVGFKLQNIYIPSFNLLAIILLWVYSTRFKKKILVGNIIISLLTGWVILVLMVAAYPISSSFHGTEKPRLLRVSFLYAGFAFIISLIREVIKDMEDIVGDLRYNCQTMPIKWGIPVSKVFTAVWLVVLASALIIVQFYIWSIGWMWSSFYIIIFIILPLIQILKKLYTANSVDDYRKLSKYVKLVMFTGILSMIFFRLYL